MPKHTISAKKIDQIIKQTCKKFKAPELVRNIKWYWDSRPSNAIAHATPRSQEMGFSTSFMPVLSQEQQTEAVVHETCHMLEEHLYGTVGHGPKWKKLMKDCGYEPTTWIDIDNPFMWC